MLFNQTKPNQTIVREFDSLSNFSFTINIKLSKAY